MKKKDSIIKRNRQFCTSGNSCICIWSNCYCSDRRKSTGNLRGIDQEITFDRKRLYEYAALCIAAYFDMDLRLQLHSKLICTTWVVEGQMLLGGFFAGITGAYLNISNPFISKLICFLVAIICGMLFALIPAILKAKCNVNEMVVTLMLNYAVSKTLEFLTTGVFKDKSAGYVATPTIKEDVMFKRFGASRMTMFFVIAMIILVIMYFVMKKIKTGI